MYDPEAIAVIRAAIAWMKTTKAMQEQRGNHDLVKGYGARIKLLEADLEERCRRN